MMCAMRGCLSKGRIKGRRYFKFPVRNPERLKAWLAACGQPELALRPLNNSDRVCDLHFKKSDISNAKYLNSYAVPASYDTVPVENEPVQTDSVICLNSDDETEDHSQLPGPSTSNNELEKKSKKEKYKRLCLNLLTKLYPLNDETILNKLDTLVNFLCNLKQLNHSTSDKLQFRIYALFLYLSGPLTYKVIRSALRLPTLEELKKTHIEVDAVTSHGFNEVLKSKISGLAEPDKHCTVCVKKMPLKRFLYYRIAKDKVIGCHDVNGSQVLIPATHAYVMIARGLRAGWEQPLAFCFVADSQPKEDIIGWLDIGLITAMEIGFNVAAVVVDHEDLYEHFKNRIVSFVQPHFLLNERKIYCIFDLPQLIISLRNTLMSHELQFLDDDGSQLVADWGTIRDLYTNYDVDDRCLLVPKLTKSHIYPPGEAEKKELKYAAQVFSKSVSLALEMENKRIGLSDTKLRGTQKLVELVNEVFDVLNSSASNHHNKCKNAFTGEPYQMKVIRKFMKFLTDVKPNDSFFEDDSFNCIYGLRITIMSLSIMLRDLLPKGITSLKTHRFNLHAADRFFEVVKRRSKSEKPTAVQFYRCFRPIFMTGLIKYPASKTKDNLDNFSKLLNSAMCKAYHSKMILSSTPETQTCCVGTVSYRFDLPSSDGFRYMCWYLLKSCYETHLCDSVQLKEFQFTKNDPRWETYFEPPALFVEYIKMLDNHLMTEFGHDLKNGLANSLYTAFTQYRFVSVCPCFPYFYLQKLFIRMRIFQIFRHNNRMYRDELKSHTSSLLTTIKLE